MSRTTEKINLLLEVDTHTKKKTMTLIKCYAEHKEACN